ncbi:hypothetical protein ACHAXT_005190 [Thalassiosira profunda]
MVTILFDAPKGETRRFKRLLKRLRTFAKVQLNREAAISSERLEECELLVTQRQQFSDEELNALKAFVDGGGSLAVFSCEGKAQSPECNANALLADYGVSIERTTLVRAVYHTFLHPKHALIQNGVVQPEIGVEKHTPLNGTNRSRHLRQSEPSDNLVEPSMSLSFVYPNGTTLSVQSPAYTLLSSGSTSYPVDCPIAATWESTSLDGEQGRVLVVGSSDMFADEWLEKEENSQLCDVLFRYLLRQNVSFDPSLGRADFEEKGLVPDIASLSNMVKPCLHENEPLPQDYKSLLCDDLFRVHNDFVPDVIDLYKRLNVPYEPLALVQPQFECPHPPLRMATHPPRTMDPPPPALELFDLDESFADARVRLAQLTNRLSEFDFCLEHYVNEAGWILDLDVGADDASEEAMAKRVLHHVGEQIFLSKMQGGAEGIGSEFC